MEPKSSQFLQEAVWHRQKVVKPGPDPASCGKVFRVYVINGSHSSVG